jgi:hypothetical protein
MAIRIHQSLVRGEIDNHRRGRICGLISLGRPRWINRTLLPSERLEIFCAELFGIQQEILALMERFRSKWT